MKKFLRWVMVLLIIVGTSGALAENEEFKNKTGPAEEVNIKVIEYFV